LANFIDGKIMIRKRKEIICIAIDIVS
jgi:hypothetical protein